MIPKPKKTKKKKGYIRVNKQPDRNPSIIPGFEEIEGVTVPHEIFFGRKNRLICFEHGLWVNLTPTQHAEAHKAAEFDFYLKQTGQRAYELEHTREEFIALIGRSYIDMTLKQWLKEE